MSQTKAQLLDGKASSIEFSTGSASSPTISFDGNTNTGIYSPGADQVAISTAGTGRLFVNAAGNVAVTGDLTLNARSDLRFADTDSSNWVAFQAPATVSSNVTWTLPSADGTANQVLSTNGSGTLSWATAGGGATDKIEEGNTSAEVIDTGSDGRFVVTTEGTERLRIDSTGRLGLGTNDPFTRLDVKGFSESDSVAQFLNSTENSAARIWAYPNGVAFTSINFFNGIQIGSDTLDIYSGGYQRVRIDSSGRLLYGTSTARANFQQTQVGNPLFSAVHQIEGAVDTTTRVTSQVYGKSDASGPAFVFAKHRSNFIGGQAITAQNDTLGEISFQGSDGTNFIEGVNIKATHYYNSSYSGTDYLEGTLTISVRDGFASTPHIRLRRRGILDFFTNNQYLTLTTSGSAYSTIIYGFYNGDGFEGGSSGAFGFEMTANGSWYNQTGVYSSFSDIKLKENIVDAGSQWDDLKALRVRKYNLKEGQTHTQIGLVAQEVELVSPGLVDDLRDRDKDGNELDTVTKAVKYSVLYMKAIKALQEAMERIETLEAKVAALEGL